MTHERAGGLLVRYEAALWSVLGATAYLARGNSDLVYPDVLWLFALLLLVSAISAWTVRRWPRWDAPHAACTILAFGVIAAIQSRSGGPRSNLWVLYLLPLFAAALLLRGRELILIAAGAVVCDAALYLGADGAWGASAAFELSVKTGVLLGAAGSAWALADAERRALARVNAQRAELDAAAAGLRRTEASLVREHALAEVGMNCAASAHDMSTPLMVIRGYARVLADRSGEDEEMRRDLQRIDRAAAFCQRLAGATLTRARGDQTGPERFSLVRALESALSMSEDVLVKRGIAVRRDCDGDDFEMCGDGQALERLFLNLIGNAAKAMPGGGLLTVRIRAVHAGADRRAEVCVEDSGAGFPEELLPRLFAPFVTTRAEAGGTGLGLYTCRETVRRHGGELTARNLDGGGACLAVSLPLASRAAASV